jgi:hypothetical protein
VRPNGTAASVPITCAISRVGASKMKVFRRIRPKPSAFARRTKLAMVT